MPPLLLAAIGLVLLTRIGVHSSYATVVLPSLLIIGAGFGLVFAPVFNTGTFGVAPHDAGVASATINTGQQLGGSIGTSLLNTFFASTIASYIAAHLSPATAVHGRPSQQLILTSFPPHCAGRPKATGGAVSAANCPAWLPAMRPNTAPLVSPAPPG
jgi:hypothetical protein